METLSLSPAPVDGVKGGLRGVAFDSAEIIILLKIVYRTHNTADSAGHAKNTHTRCGSQSREEILHSSQSRLNVSDGN